MYIGVSVPVTGRVLCHRTLLQRLASLDRSALCPGLIRGGIKACKLLV